MASSPTAAVANTNNAPTGIDPTNTIKNAVKNTPDDGKNKDKAPGKAGNKFDNPVEAIKNFTASLTVPVLIERTGEATNGSHEGSSDNLINKSNGIAQTNSPKVIKDINAYIAQLLDEDKKAEKIRDAGQAPENEITLSEDNPKNTKFKQVNVRLGTNNIYEYKIDGANHLTEAEIADFWDRIDKIRHQMGQPDSVEDIDQVNVQILLGTTATLTAGFVSWLLRGGSLLASFLSTVPLLKRFDILPILKESKKSKGIFTNPQFQSEGRQIAPDKEEIAEQADT